MAADIRVGSDLSFTRLVLHCVPLHPPEVQLVKLTPILWMSHSLVWSLCAVLVLVPQAVLLLCCQHWLRRLTLKLLPVLHPA